MSASRIPRWAIAAALIVAAGSLTYGGVVAAHGFSSGPSSSGTTYNVTFSETGLPSGTNWSIVAFSVNSSAWSGEVRGTSNTSSISLALSNGSYGYFVHAVRGYEVLSGGHGAFNVTGASPAGMAVTFGVPAVYAVTFTEHGLPANTTWSVRLRPLDRVAHGVGSRLFGRTNNTTLTFELPNGSYGYVAHAHGFRATNGSRGSFNVSGASPAGLSVNFSEYPRPTQYTVTFTETGLPSGTNWTAVVGGGGWGGGRSPHHGHEAVTTSNASLNFTLSNGTYYYAIVPVAGYAIADNGSHGSVNVSGASPATISITFVALTYYNVTFSETGLPSGTNWSVVAVSASGPSWGASVFGTSNGTSLTLSLANGTYYYLVSGTDGYAPSGHGYGSFSVSGASPAAIEISFSLPSWGSGGWHTPA